jgi:hypothetical protein
MTGDIMSTHRTQLRSLARLLTAAVALALFVATTTLIFSVMPRAAHAADEESEDDSGALRASWQDRYRGLLQDRARFSEGIAISNKNYTQAQRRNYPRGGARQQFLLDAANAEKKLAETEEKITGIFDEARDAGVPPGWLYEVEDEPVIMTRPASPNPGMADPAGEEDREGRNPLYFKDDEQADENAP